MSDDLVMRLREQAHLLPTTYVKQPLMHDAADRIEELEARVELLEGYLRGSLEIIERSVACDTAEARAALEGKNG